MNSFLTKKFHFFLILFLSFGIFFTGEATVLQPQFKWADHTCTQQGTGSFIRAPNGDVLGLTSAHFINFSGPQLLEVEWLDIKTGQPIAISIKSWGLPGHEGCYNPLDLRSDYILLVIENSINCQNILELDATRTIEVGERVWFPNKNASSHLGYDRIEGTVNEVKNTHIVVTLDQTIDLQARSGTPVIRQKTGKVIGILTGGDMKDKSTLLYLAPSSSIYRALHNAQQCPLLKDVIGKQMAYESL